MITLHTVVFLPIPLSKMLLKVLWKRPGNKNQMFEKLIRYALLSNMRNHELAFIERISKDELVEFLKNEIKMINSCFDCKKKEKFKLIGFILLIEDSMGLSTMSDSSFFSNTYFLTW